jgi:hypothetical protein
MPLVAIGFITGAAGGAWAEYIYQSQGKGEGERFVELSVCDREADERKRTGDGNIRWSL